MFWGLYDQPNFGYGSTAWTKCPGFPSDNTIVEVVVKPASMVINSYIKTKCGLVTIQIRIVKKQQKQYIISTKQHFIAQYIY